MDLNQHMPIFIKSTVNVFREMLGLTVSSGQVQNEGEGFLSQGLTVMVGFCGGWRGWFFLDMSQGTALKLTEILIGEQYDTVAEEEVLLSGAEVGNIISGNAITSINNNQPGLNIRLTPPSVFAGEEMSLYNVRLSSHSVLMQTEAGSIKINVVAEEGKG